MAKHIPITNPLSSDDAPDCPAHRLALRIQRLIQERDEIAGGERPADSGWNELVKADVEQLLEVVRLELAWTKATSLQGVYAQVCEASRLQDLALRSAADSAIGARLARLTTLLRASLRELAGVDDYDLGGADVGNYQDVYVHVLLRHTGQDIRLDEDRRLGNYV